MVAARFLAVRNLLGTLLLSTGVPMLCAGDEAGRTQRGNNNAYCQDNETSWLRWDLSTRELDLLATTRRVLELRRRFEVLRPRQFFAGSPQQPDGTTDLVWYAPDGGRMDPDTWNDTGLRTLQMFLDGTHADGRSVLVVLHGGYAADLTLPLSAGVTSYELLWDSGHEAPAADADAEVQLPGQCVRLAGPSVRLYAAR